MLQHNLQPSITRRNMMREIIKRHHGDGRYFKITEHKANLIITRILELKIANLYKNGYVHIGHGFGDVVIKSVDRNAKSLDNYIVNWKQTKQLWEHNQQAKETKKLVRDLSATKQLMFRWTNKSNITNLCYYDFRPCRQLRMRVYKDMINNKPIMFLT